MKEFPFPSLCLLKKCTEGQLVAVKLDPLKTLKNCGFRVRAIALDNHFAKVLALSEKGLNFIE